MSSKSPSDHSLALARRLDAAVEEVCTCASRRARGEINEQDHIDEVRRLLLELYLEAAPIPFDECQPLPETCTPLQEECAPSQEACAPIQEECPPLQEECAPLQGKCAPPLLVDEEYCPGNDDPLDWTLECAAVGGGPAEPPCPAKGGVPRKEEPKLPCPGRPAARAVPHNATAGAPARCAAPGGRSGGSRVIVSGTASWERDAGTDLEDTMFRMGIDEDLAEDVLRPTEMRARDKEFITERTRRMIEESGKDKNPGTAFLLSLLLPGLGGLYAGSLLGFAFLVPAMGCAVAAVLGLADLSTLGSAYVVAGVVSALQAASAVNGANAKRLRMRQARPEPKKETTFNLAKGMR